MYRCYPKGTILMSKPTYWNIYIARNAFTGGRDLRSYSVKLKAVPLGSAGNWYYTIAVVGNLTGITRGVISFGGLVPMEDIEG
jgi:hypothetical protein